MLFFTFLLGIHSLCSTARAAALPEPSPYALPAPETASIASAETTDIVLYSRSPSTDLEEVSTSSSFDNRGLSLSTRQPGVSDAVLIAGITAVKDIAVAACANPWVCALLIAVVAIGAFYYIYKSTNDAPSYGPGQFTPSRRLPASFSPQFHAQYAATTDCDTACQLEAKLPEGEWTNIGNATADGVFHYIHHFRNGTTRGIRASQSSASVASVLYPTKNKRQNPYDQGDDASMIGDFYWSAPNVAAYDTFDSTSSTTQNSAQDMTNFMEGGNWIEVCLDFMDSNGALDSGVYAMGWNNEPFIFSSQSALDSQLAACDVGEVYYQGEPQTQDNL
jgi:hypothetical protein